jgi:hypothetical protein
VKVYVDGTLDATVDTYAATASYRVQAWAKSWSTAGSHTIRLEVVGTAGHPRIELDAIAILGASEPPPVGGTPPPVGGTPPPPAGLTPPPTEVAPLVRSGDGPPVCRWPSRACCSSAWWPWRAPCAGGR